MNEHELAELFRKLGAPNPLGWARSQAQENLPQLASISVSSTGVDAGSKIQMMQAGFLEARAGQGNRSWGRRRPSTRPNVASAGASPEEL